jgi:hypothetical protein
MLEGCQKEIKFLKCLFEKNEREVEILDNEGECSQVPERERNFLKL